MPLPPACPSRQPKHRRSIAVQVFARDDGLWEVDATLVDTKTRDLPLGGGVRRAGDAIHDMLLRLVVDRGLNIVAAGSQTLAMPYVDQCADHDDAYARLAGLNLARGFRRALLDRVGGVRGCTHLTELAQVLPTAVIQAFAGEVIDARAEHPGAQRPFQIDRCHALRAEGDVVRVHFPRWHRQPDANIGADNAPSRAAPSPA